MERGVAIVWVFFMSNSGCNIYSQTPGANTSGFTLSIKATTQFFVLDLVTQLSETAGGRISYVWYMLKQEKDETKIPTICLTVNRLPYSVQKEDTVNSQQRHLLSLLYCIAQPIVSMNRNVPMYVLFVKRIVMSYMVTVSKNGTKWGGWSIFLQIHN